MTTKKIITQSMTNALDTLTFPRLLLEHAKTIPTRPAYREKYLGIWQVTSWADNLEQIKQLSCGLASEGFKRGMNLAIIGENRPQLYQAMVATQCLGGVPVPLYQDAVAVEMIHVLNDAEIAFAIVENQEQVDKLLEIKDQVPSLRVIIYEDPKGLKDYVQSYLHSLKQIQTLGKIFDEEHPEFFLTELEAGNRDDLSVILYTSGTTGKPKGVAHTHQSFIQTGINSSEFDCLNERDNILAYLPMAWVGDHLFSYAQAMVTGLTVNCPESKETVMADMREIGPSYYFAPPRIFESLLTQVTIRMEDAGLFKRKLFEHAMHLSKKVGSEILDGHSVSLLDRLRYFFYNIAIYAPLRNALGMSNIRVAYTAGEAIGPDLFRFYRSIGVNLKQFYGQTETCAYVCLQPDGQVKYDSVGIAAPGIEIKLAESGEVLVKGISVMDSYYKRPDATSESIDDDGYFHTGDAGIIDKDGHLRIIDRAKDVGKMANGKLFAPKYIENKLKFFPFVKEAVVFGDAKESITTFINIDFEAIANWAERRHIAFAGYIDLASKTEVYKMIGECIDKVNVDLSKDPMLSHAQIARFLILHKELDPDDDELTRTRKVRRGFIAEKYAPLLDALYSNKTEQFIETKVKFEDGRDGSISATVQIQDANTVMENA
ncbi:AMP-dependent synthetase/ligase [Polynucleobacter asymbioticus]|nr:AMP-binding protein [Polynucleobacter asymbioticus]